MRSHPAPVLAACAAVAAMAVPCAAQKAPRKELEKSYSAMAQALKRRDMDAFMKHMTPDYQVLGNGKGKDAKTFKAEMALRLLMLKTITSTSLTITALKETKDGARASVTMAVAGVLATDPKQPHTLKSVSKHADNWAKTPEGWRIKTTEPAGSQLYVDGKPFDPSNPPKPAGAAKPGK
ncbi:MAG: nuclear transport factor 2 family protein [Armatimonadetes bacterium]|nr:nuclear transport factor 2 family protein [Armatimonadota bacterium]